MHKDSDLCTISGDLCTKFSVYAQKFRDIKKNDLVMHKTTELENADKATFPQFHHLMNQYK